MYDKTKFLVRIKPGDIIPYYYEDDVEGRPRKVEYRCFVFTADRNGMYRTEIKNLRFTITREFSYFIIENSFHKYCHGNNHSNFLFTEFLEVCDEILKTFSLDSDEVIIWPFEFGINIKISSKLIDYIDSHQKKEIQAMHHRGKSYGKKAYRTQYYVKIYDKKQEVKFQNEKKKRYGKQLDKEIEETIRIEMEYTKMQKVPFIKTLSDMMNPANVLKLYVHLINAYRELDKDPLFDTTQFTRKERLILSAGRYPKFWKTEKQINPNTAKKDRLLYNKLMMQNRNIGLYSNVEDEMINTMQVILESVLNEL